MEVSYIINITPEIEKLYETQKKDERILGGMTIDIGEEIPANSSFVNGIANLIKSCKMSEADKQFLGL